MTICNPVAFWYASREPMPDVVPATTKPSAQIGSQQRSELRTDPIRSSVIVIVITVNGLISAAEVRELSSISVAQTARSSVWRSTAMVSG